jgi:uncharacterized damage-inducible protein DinB
MDAYEPFLIAPVPGFSPEAGRLVAMLRYARATTLSAVQGLTVAQLDHLHDPGSNSIGALLAHVAAVERFYQVRSFERRDPSEEELDRWRAALDLGQRARRTIRGHPLAQYLDDLAAVRARTLEAFRAVDDAWLDERDSIGDGRPVHHYWQWFHVFEDELSHRGQIRWLRARLPS